MTLRRNKKIVIGDLHLDKNNLDTAEIFFDFLTQHLSSPENQEVDIELIFLGDIYHTKAIIRSEAQNFLIKKLQNLIEIHSCMSIYIIVGNHDYNNMSCDEHALTPLKSLSPRIHIIDEPSKSYNGLFLPYYNTNKGFVDALKNTIGPTVKYIFCHQGIEGFDYGNGIIDRDGVSIKDLIEYNVEFIIGHYHKQQKSGNIFYLGTPYSHSFGEANQIKGILEIIDGKQDFLITNDFIPCHYKLKYAEYEFNEDSKKVLEYIKENDFVEVQISCTREFASAFSKEKFIEDILKINVKNLRVKFDLIDNNKSVRLDENQSLEVVFKQYLEQNKLDYLYDMGMMFLKDANLQV